MKLAASLLGRALDAIDICFDAAGALWRVLVRGAFAPDARAYRASRFAQLGASDVLVQEIALNAADQDEARKAVALDAERLLPLAPDLVVYDVAGPIEQGDRPRARPESAFLLGAVRKDALERVRAALPVRRRGGVEAFVHAPAAHPGLAFVFGDELGKRSRRLRRATLALSLAVFALAASETLRSTEAALERASAAAAEERVAAERRIRLAERRLSAAEAARQALAETSGPPLAQASAALARLALHQPADAELNAVALSGRELSLSGRAYAPDAAELALRRAFEGAEISFTASEADSEAAPQAFEARLSLAAGESQ